jgi:glucokinase
MWKLTNGRLDKADGTTAFAARREKDAAATEVVRSYASYLACGIGNLINILEPDTICLGGGVSREGDDLLIPVIESLCSFMWVKNSVPFYTRLVCAAFGNDAAMIEPLCWDSFFIFFSIFPVSTIF